MMHTQETDTAVIENEKQLIKNIVGLSSKDQITLNDRGWDSRVYSFHSGRYFFKFPRSEKIQTRYKYEIAAIKLIAGLDTGIVTQKIMWEQPENAYFGYKGVKGKPIREIIHKLDTSTKKTVGGTLGSFLKQFHGLKIEGLREVTLRDEAKQIRHWYENNIETITRCFSESEQKKLHQNVYDIWPSKLIEMGLDSVLSHGDLHFENVLYGNDGAIGIIDFGDVAYYDRSIDFFELDEAKEILDAALKAYGIDYPNFIQKIALRQDTVQLINLGFHAGKKDEASIDRTVRKIRGRL